MNVVYQSERRITPKLRCFIDFIVERFGKKRAEIS